MEEKMKDKAVKTLKELGKEFKNMSLSKQALISIAAITGAVAILSNYKNIKNRTKDIVAKITNNENVKEFMNDVDNTFEGIGQATKKFIDGKVDETTVEKEVLNEDKPND